MNEVEAAVGLSQIPKLDSFSLNDKQIIGSLHLICPLLTTSILFLIDLEMSIFILLP